MVRFPIIYKISPAYYIDLSSDNEQLNVKSSRLYSKLLYSKAFVPLLCNYSDLRPKPTNVFWKLALLAPLLVLNLQKSKLY